MNLAYTGGDPSTRFVPGWAAADHEEPDAGLAAQKLQSGLYAEAVATETTQAGKAASRGSQRATAALDAGTEGS